MKGNDFRSAKEWIIGIQRKMVWLAVCSTAIAVMVLYPADLVLATPPISGFVGTTIVSGRFAEFEVFNHLSKDSLPVGFDGEVWLSLQKTKGPSDVFVQSNTWTARDPITGAITASTGWHSHPGHSLIIIKSGAVTEYEGDCTPRVYGPGQPLGATLVDPGGDHVHLIRNEGTVPVIGYAVQVIPAGAARRIDEPAPDACSNIN
jgi:hypothetical protein